MLSARLFRPSIGMFGGEFTQVRFRKRRGILMQKVAMQRKRQKQADERANPPPPKLSFIERVMQASKKGSVQSLAEQFPAREGINDDETTVPLPEAPELSAKRDLNVLFMNEYKPRVYSIKDAIQLHRQCMHPTVYNIPDATVRLRLDLNMSLERKTRFTPEQSMVIDVPHLFPHNEKRTLLAFVRTPELIEAAQKEGVDQVAAPELIKKITKGLFRTDDYEYVIAHTEMIQDIVSMRGVLKKKFPSKLNGALGDDIVALVRRFKDGIQYKIRADQVHKKYGVCDTVVGNLSMSDEQLEANMIKVIEEVSKVRAPLPSLGHFIDRALVMLQVPMGSYREHYAVNYLQHCPEMPTEEEIEKQKAEQKLRSKGGKKRAAEEEIKAESVEPVVVDQSAQTVVADNKPSV